MRQPRAMRRFAAIGGALLSLVMLSLGVGLAASPTLVLQIADAQSGARVYCLPAAERAQYVSRNSIYNVPVTETWSLADGSIRIALVQSAPAVLDYYGIVDYRLDADGTAEGAPRDLHYEQVRIKVVALAQQRLLSGARSVELSQQFADGTTLVVGAHQAARLSTLFDRC